MGTVREAATHQEDRRRRRLDDFSLAEITSEITIALRLTLDRALAHDFASVASGLVECDRLHRSCLVRRNELDPFEEHAAGRWAIANVESTRGGAPLVEDLSAGDGRSGHRQ